jgi:hypothetical protein
MKTGATSRTTHEVQKHAITDRDVLTVVAVEGWTHDGALADVSKEFAQQHLPLFR